MDAEALRTALASDAADSGSETADPVTTAGRKLADKLELDDEGLDLLTELVQAVVESQ